jgi:hypothetical protein
LNIPKKQKNKKRFEQKAKKKICKYPGCGKEFMGIGPAKYCNEHKKPEFRKIIYKILSDKKNKIENANQIIEHKYYENTNVIHYCDCCDVPFEITLIPKIYVYPKYCPKHRNQHKRDLYNSVEKT